MGIKSILVSQPRPASENNPFSKLADKYNLQIDYRPFIQVEPVDAKEFRQSRIDILNQSAVILTSKNAVDHFFRICKDMRVTVPDSMKYFCITEAIAYYLQKYVVYRKRKIFHGKHNFNDLIEVIRKHKNEKFLLPCSDIHKKGITEVLEENEISYKKAVLYRTVASDLSDLADIYYDMLVFFSPSGIESLLKNFPDFKQNTTKIAAFGKTTSKAVEDVGLTLDVKAPMPKAPSMTMAIEQFILQSKKKSGVDKPVST